MTAVRIQDFNENSKPDINNDFLMTFNDNSESKTRLRDAFYSMMPEHQALTPVYVNSRDDVAAQDAYIVIVNDDN